MASARHKPISAFPKNVDHACVMVCVWLPEVYMAIVQGSLVWYSIKENNPSGQRHKLSIFPSKFHVLVSSILFIIVAPSRGTRPHVQHQVRGIHAHSSHPGLLKDRLGLRFLGRDGRSFGAVTAITKLRKGNTKNSRDAMPSSARCLSDEIKTTCLQWWEFTKVQVTPSWITIPRFLFHFSSDHPQAPWTMVYHLQKRRETPFPLYTP